MKTIEQGIGQKIKKIRKARKLTQKMLASGICSQSVLSRIETDQEIPNVLVFQQLCKRLGTTMDKVMLSEFTEIQAIQSFFDKMNNYLIHQRYQEMASLFDESQILTQLYLDTDLQLYFYYLGTVEFFVDQDLDKAITTLKHSLAYTYTESKKEHVSSVEVQILGCLGRIYADMNRMTLAENYLTKSISLAVCLPSERATYEISKIFYHYARYLYTQEAYLDTIDIAMKGVHWAIDKLSYYYVQELLQITGGSYEKLHEFERAQFMYEKAQSVKFFDRFDNGIYLS